MYESQQFDVLVVRQSTRELFIAVSSGSKERVHRRGVSLFLVLSLLQLHDADVIPLEREGVGMNRGTCCGCLSVTRTRTHTFSYTLGRNRSIPPSSLSLHTNVPVTNVCTTHDPATGAHTLQLNLVRTKGLHGAAVISDRKDASSCGEVVNLQQRLRSLFTARRIWMDTSETRLTAAAAIYPPVVGVEGYD